MNENEKIKIPNKMHDLHLSAFDFTMMVQLIHLTTNEKYDCVTPKDINEFRFRIGTIKSVSRDGVPRSGKTSASIKYLANRGLLVKKGHKIKLPPELLDIDSDYYLIYSWVLTDKLKEIGVEAFRQYCLYNRFADRHKPSEGVYAKIGYEKIRSYSAFEACSGDFSTKAISNNTIVKSNNRLVEHGLIRISSNHDGNPRKRNSNKYEILRPAISKKYDKKCPTGFDNAKSNIVPIKQETNIEDIKNDDIGRDERINFAKRIAEKYSCYGMNLDIAEKEIKHIMALGYDYEVIEAVVNSIFDWRALKEGYSKRKLKDRTRVFSYIKNNCIPDLDQFKKYIERDRKLAASN